MTFLSDRWQARIYLALCVVGLLAGLYGVALWLSERWLGHPYVRSVPSGARRAVLRDAAFEWPDQ